MNNLIKRGGVINRVISNIGWLFADKILRMGVGLFVGVWVARYLGPEQFGLMNFATAFVAIFAGMANLGLQSIVVRELVSASEERFEIVGTATVILLISGLCGYILLILGIVILRSSDYLAIMLVVIYGAILLIKSTDIIIYWYESQTMSKHVVWIQNLVFVIFAAIKILLIQQNATIEAFALAFVGEAFVVSITIAAIFNRKVIKLKQLKFNLNRAKSILTQSWPLLLSSIAIMIYMKVDQIMLAQMVGNEAVGIYSAALRISEIWYILPAIIVSSVFPSLTKIYESDSEKFDNNLQKLYRILIWTAILIAILITISAEGIISKLYGESYIAASTVLIWHIWGAVFVFFGTAWTKWLVLQGFQKDAAKLHAMTLAANIILNLILIPQFGAPGAAMATTISYSLGHTVFMLFFTNQRKAVFMFWKSFGII